MNLNSVNSESGNKICENPDEVNWSFNRHSLTMLKCINSILSYIDIHCIASMKKKFCAKLLLGRDRNRDVIDFVFKIAFVSTANL